MHCLIVSDPKIVMFFFKCILLGIAFISPFCCLTGDCANISERTALHAKLLNSSTYNPYVRPVENSSLPVSVQFRFAPVIHYLVQGDQELQLRGRMALIWDDHRLAWNPDDYGGLRRLDLPVNKIWQPEVVLYERTPTDTDLNIQIETEFAKVLSNGTVSWHTMATTRSFCFMDVRKFPFDKQNCEVTFTTWMHQENEQLLYHNDDLFINDTYKQNEARAGEWDMTLFHYDPSYRCLYCVEERSYITYKVTLIRSRPGLALFTFVFPCLMVVLMTCLLFCFPVGDAKVATYGLTCMLAFVVFLQALFNLLPSTDVCYVGIATVGFMIVGTGITSWKVLRWRVNGCPDIHTGDAGSKRNDTNGGEEKGDKKGKDDEKEKGDKKGKDDEKEKGDKKGKDDEKEKGDKKGKDDEKEKGDKKGKDDEKDASHANPIDEARSSTEHGASKKTESSEKTRLIPGKGDKGDKKEKYMMKNMTKV